MRGQKIKIVTSPPLESFDYWRRSYSAALELERERLALADHIKSIKSASLCAMTSGLVSHDRRRNDGPAR